MIKRVLISSTITSFLLIGFTQAADFNVSPQTGTFGAKQEFEVNLKIDSAGESINAAQAKIKFSANIIEVKSVSKDGSIFNFWLQEPKFSNTDGTIEFISGTPNGISGSSLQVLKIIFTTKGIGSSDISFIDSSITAADGSGTNILAKANGAKFIVSSSVVIPTTSSLASPVPPAPPVQITRIPTQATGLPTVPNVSVSLYPNPDNWYNFVSQFNVSWKLPLDILGLSTAMNANPNFVAPTISEGLFDSKTYPAINKDGIYYFHIRFQNNKGWGPTAHYRMAVDTQPPIPFKIDVKTGLSSDNPSPKLVFNTSDSLSGISHDEIIINEEEPIVINLPEFSLLPRQPGEYTVRVRIFDNAGNSIEDKVKIEILPIETPTITSISKKVILGTDDNLLVKGLAIADASVIVTIEDRNKFLVFQGESKTNVQGEWELRFDEELRRGNYFVSVTAKDSRGAVSLPTESAKVSFVEKPIISLFGLDITLRGLLVIFTIVVLSVALWFYRKTLLRLARSQRESTIINRDIKNSFGMVKEDLDKISGIAKKDSSVDTKEIELNVINKKIKDNLDNIEKYSSKDIEKLG